MAYNKLLSNFKLNQSNISNDNTLYSTNQSFDFTDHLKPKNIDNLIIFENDNILINQDINILQASNINELNAKDIRFNQNSGIKIDGNNLLFYNTNANIEINTNLTIDNDLYFNGEVLSSIAYTNISQTNKLVRSLGGGIAVSVEKDGIYDYLNIGLSNVGNDLGAINTNANITFLSNQKSYNIQAGKIYDNNLDINYLTSTNKLYQINFINNQLTSSVTSLNNSLTTFYSNNSLNSPNLFNVDEKYDIIPNCTIFRPGNDLSNLKYYFNGDSHIVLIENNQNQFNSLNNNIHMHLIDLTSQNFIDNLSKGFKFEILVGKFKTDLFSVEYNTTTRKQYIYPNYLPYRENINISKQLPLGYPYSITLVNTYNANPNLLINGKLKIYQWGPIAGSDNYTLLQTQFRTLQNNALNIFGTTNWAYNNKFYTPANPALGDYFSFWFYTGSAAKIYIYLNGTNTLLIPMFSISSSYPLTWVWNGTNWILDDCPNPYTYDAGGINYPSHILLELPTNHYITGKDVLNYNSHYIHRYKNNKDFYLYGNKLTDADLLLTDLSTYSNGGWLFDKSELSLKNNFKKLYKNIYCLVANNSLKTIKGMNWQPYSNFQLIYLGNNEWYIN